MPTALVTVTIHCPYCGGTYGTTIDMTVGDQSYIEDCGVCCQPITLTVSVDLDGELESVTARNDSD
ncbi:CPXCG motif-containing cysteine-rich protein [Tahibacter amnicola]|uniref:CPXCG motif-containing cysteine-rich protein n=1 Tax=Tahibacter amnicola TaxID=2976241 RepID=A0ABY6BH21_9GAMM|nr:CPXCG motif-containing cysteine-rich protein [Tahibacter amnicola]UXI67901.1 CPXCG motif-containing cysteine-rich protein [Tahibacter amnicola]